MNSAATFVILFSIATGVAIVVRRLKIPYTVALVVVGLVLSATNLMEAPHLTRELLFAVFLPGLLFDAAFNLEAGAFWGNRLTIGSLAVPGVVAGILLTGLIVTFAIQSFGLVDGFSWRHGLVFGALVAATDPIAVVALFRELNAPHRLRVIVEGESLLNDGTSIVALTLILAVVNGTSTTAFAVIREFLTIVGGGAAIGWLLGLGLSHIILRIDDAMIEITLTSIAAYGSFILAEQLHYSGVIATVSAGLVCGLYARRVGMSPSTQLAVQTFWEYVAFALNSVIFLLIGFDVGFTALASYWQIILIAFVAMLAARAALIMGVTGLLQRTAESIPLKWGLAVTWSGLRGALSMVLALALPVTFPGRDVLIAMTFGVVLASILVQGLTMPVMLRRLGIVKSEDARFSYDLARGRLQVAARLRREVTRMRDHHAAPTDLLDLLEENYSRRSEAAIRALRALHNERDDLREEEAAVTVEHLLRVERAELVDRLRSGLMHRNVFDRLAGDVDKRIIRVRAGNFETVDEIIPFTSEWKSVSENTSDDCAADDSAADDSAAKPE